MINSETEKYIDHELRIRIQEIIQVFALKMLHQTQDLEPIFAEMIEKRFWDLL